MDDEQSPEDGQPGNPAAADQSRRADASAAGDTTGSGAAASPEADATTVVTKGGHRKRGFFRTHWLAVIIAGVLAVVLVVAGLTYGYYWYLHHKLDQVTRVHVPITQATNSAGQPVKDTDTALNILLVGVDKNETGNGSLSDAVKQKSWPLGSFRTDTIMVVHIPKDRKSATLISIPRDTWIAMPECHKYAAYYDNCHDKINAAFSYGGPKLMVEAVQRFTGLRLDHFAAIDWNGFKDLTTALGGVKVYIPTTVVDPKQKDANGNFLVWTQGWHNLKGDLALQYVRMRYNLPNGDFDRIARQQNFLRATMKQLLSDSVRHNPYRFLQVVGAVTSHLVVDSGWQSDEIRDVALSMRGVSSTDISFFTLQETAGTSTSGASIQVADLPLVREMFGALANGHVQRFVRNHPNVLRTLGNSRSVH